MKMQYNEIMEKTNTMQEVPPEIRCRKYHQKYDAGSTTRNTMQEVPPEISVYSLWKQTDLWKIKLSQ